MFAGQIQRRTVGGVVQRDRRMLAVHGELPTSRQSQLHIFHVKEAADHLSDSGHRPQSLILRSLRGRSLFGKGQGLFEVAACRRLIILLM